MFATLSSRPQILHTSFKKIIASFLLAVFFVISIKVMICCFYFAPLAMMATSHIEILKKIKQEMVLCAIL
jgi:hypothetical protein